MADSLKIADGYSELNEGLFCFDMPVTQNWISCKFVEPNLCLLPLIMFSDFGQNLKKTTTTKNVVLLILLL